MKILSSMRTSATAFIKEAEDFGEERAGKVKKTVSRKNLNRTEKQKKTKKMIASIVNNRHDRKKVIHAQKTNNRRARREGERPQNLDFNA